MSCENSCNGASLDLPIGATGSTGAAATVVVPNTVFVSTSGSDSTGTVERLDLPYLTIAAAITAAVTLTPASTKRVNIVVFGGTFTENITIANSYITLMSFYESPLMYDDAGYATVISRFTTTKRPVHISGSITVTADYVNITGINCLTLNQNTAGANCQFSHIIASTSITTDNTAPAGSYYDVHSDIFLSLPSTGTLSGYYEKCTGGSTSFAGNSSANAGNISGTLIDCVATTYSFASANANTGGTISGTLKRCIAKNTVSFASSNSGTAGTISGILEECFTGSATSFASSASGTAGTLSGTFKRCRSNAPTSFGSGVRGGTLSGLFEDCIAQGDSFGASTTSTGGATLSGDFIRCISHDSISFGSVTTGSSSVLSGRFADCIGGEASFGCATTGTAATLSGNFENCKCSDTDNVTYCFGSSVGGTAGSISGKLINCIGIGASFCSSDTTGGTVTSTGQLINCIAIDDVMLRKAVVSGKVIGARIDSQTANEPAIIVAAGATLSKSDFKGNGTATSVHATGAVNIAATFLRTFGKGFHANVTNDVTTPYITDDSNDVF